MSGSPLQLQPDNRSLGQRLRALAHGEVFNLDDKWLLPRLCRVHIPMSGRLANSLIGCMKDVQRMYGRGPHRFTSRNTRSDLAPGQGFEP